MVLQFTTIDRIFEIVNRMKPDGFNEYDILDWTSQAIDHMKVPKVTEEAVCYVEVHNYVAPVPKWTHNIIQIAKDTKGVPAETSGGICPITIISDNPESVPEDNIDPLLPCEFFPEGENHPVVINQLGQPITNYELAHYRPYFDLQYDYLSWMNSVVYAQRFIPIRLATNSFFNTIVCKPVDETPYLSCDNEYTIKGNGKILSFSFETGCIVIAYNRHRIDEVTGFPLIPDEVSFITAIEKFIRFKYAEKDFYDYRQGSETRVTKAEADWHWYCGQAKNKLKMPNSVDEWQNLMEGNSYLIPRNHYYGFFGHLGKAEQRNYFKT